MKPNQQLTEADGTLLSRQSSQQMGLSGSAVLWEILLYLVQCGMRLFSPWVETEYSWETVGEESLLAVFLGIG